MSIFEHSRFRIFNPGQHPLKHDVSDFAYSNARLPNISLLTDAIDYIVASIYPNYQGTVDTPGDLPVSGSPNDFYIVTDDGDGKSAGYVWSVIDNTGSWLKRYDVDWSFEDILAESVNRTMFMYAHKWGFDDIDNAGAAITGAYAGQRIYGGASANTNLTLAANAGDASGHTGFVQVDDDFRPVTDSAYDCGTTTERWANVFTDSLTSGTMVISSGSIEDSSGAIDFGDNDITTTGDITGNFISVGTSGDFGTLHVASGSITDSGGTIDFDDETLTTTGDFTAASIYATLGMAIGPLAGSQMTITPGSIVDESGAIDFDDENLSTTGTFDAGDATVTRLAVDNLLLDGNTLSSTNTDGNIILDPNGTGIVDVQGPLTTLDQTVTGTVGITGQLNIDNLRLDGDTISTTDTNGDLILDPNGSGLIQLGSAFFPITDSAWDIGKSGKVWNKLWIDGAIGDGSNEITIANLLTFRAVGSPSVGDTLFWDGAKWVSSHPDTEITHSEVSGLTTGDAGHTQFVMLAGRSGGQSVQGGTAASENLTLESTAHATKGSVVTKDNLIPNSNASFSVTWSGVDLGDGTHYFRDLYTKGELKGARVENFTAATLPSASGSAIGRLAYTTDTKKIYVDIGGAWQIASGGGGGGSIQWIEDVGSPIPEIENHIRVYKFAAGDSQNIYALLKVPASYGAGSPVKLLMNFYSPDNSGNALIVAQSTLIRPATDAVSSTTNQRTTSNSAVTLGAGTVNKPQALTLDVSDTSGQINGVAISAGDLILVRLYRDTDTATSDVRVPVFGAEATYS